MPNDSSTIMVKGSPEVHTLSNSVNFESEGLVLREFPKWLKRQTKATRDLGSRQRRCGDGEFLVKDYHQLIKL